MSGNRINIWLVALIVIVALPASTAFLWYQQTRDPSLRPLGITIEEIAVSETDGSTGGINVIVNWGQDSPLAMEQSEVQAVLSRTLNVFAAEYWFTFNDVPGDDIVVGFQVASTFYGPYPLAQTASGIRLAVSAQQVIQK